MCKKIIVGILAHVFVRIVSILKSITDTLVTMCDEIIIIMDNVATRKTIATNITSTASTNCHSVKEIVIFCTQFY